MVINLDLLLIVLSPSELCTKCGCADAMSGTEDEESDLVEEFCVMDSLDTISEEDMEDTLEMISQESEESDSGLESSDEEYRDFKIFE